MSISYAHAAAVKTDGTLWVWGNGGFGRLGTSESFKFVFMKKIF